MIFGVFCVWCFELEGRERVWGIFDEVMGIRFFWGVRVIFVWN